MLLLKHKIDKEFMISTKSKSGFLEDDRDLVAAGYKPQLKRSIGFFASFAASFSIMSVLMGVFTNYGYVLGKAGPFGLWTWFIVGFGQLMVALVFAEMAGRIPLTGALYNWNDKLGHPAISSLVAWLSIFAYAIGAAGIIAIMMAPIQSLVGHAFSMNTIRLIGLAIITTQMLISIYGIRLAASINKIAVVGEIIALVIFGILLLLVVLLNGQANTTFLTHIPSSPAPYWPAFLISILLGAWTIFGFEAPSDLSEETMNVKRVVPKSIISGIITSIVLGAFFIGVVTIAIPDLQTVTGSSDPISTIFVSHLGQSLTNIFLAMVLVAMFATALLNLIVATRVLFAISRDEKFVGYSFLKKVSPNGIPYYSVMAIIAVEIITFLTMYGLPAIYASAIVLLGLAYLITVINFLMSVKKLPPTTSFSLGRWHWPVVICSVLWLVLLLVILTVPQEFHLAAKIGAGVVILGFLQHFLQQSLKKSIA